MPRPEFAAEGTALADSDEWITEARAQGRCPPLLRLRSRSEVNAWLAGFSG